MCADSLSPRQRQTLSARRALAAKFASPEEQSAHYRALAAKANAGRVTLTADEVAALGEAYALLSKIAARHRRKIEAATDGQAA